jgi:excisionase family DNA binding protein
VSTFADRPMSLESLWTWKDVAAYLRVGRSWVYEKAGSGELPARRILGMLRFDPAAIKALAVGAGDPRGVVLPLTRTQAPTR